MQPLVWTAKSTGNLAGELGRAGRPVSADTVKGRLLKDRLGYSLQGNAKTIEGSQHPDRDAQFAYMNELVSGCLAAREAGDFDRLQEERVGRQLQERRHGV